MHEALKQLHQEREKLDKQEQIVIQERKQKIAWLAEQYGLLNWHDEELRLAFEKIAATHTPR